MSRLAAEVPVQLVGEVGKMLTRREKALLLAGSAVTGSGLWLLSKQLDVPVFPGFGMSILHQPSPFVATFMMLMATALATLVGSLVAGSVRYDAGLWCAAASMIVLSARGGPIRYVLMSASSKSIFLLLAAEVLFFAACFAVGGAIQTFLASIGVIKREQHYDGIEPEGEPSRKLLAALTGTVIAASIVLLLCQSDRKLQVGLPVWFASLAGATAAYYLAPVDRVWSFLAIPILVGFIGYVATYFADPSGWVIGEPRGFLRALARPLPLDYAGAGGVGAITGYWLGRWRRSQREVDETATSNA